MLFHLGALIRLNEVGLLPLLKRISSVSGGSITAGVLGLAWKSLRFQNGVALNFAAMVVDPLRKIASKTIDISAIVRGLLLPGSISAALAKTYDKILFRGASLSDLPNDEEGPRFIYNSTNLQTGDLWRFSNPYMADYKVGVVLNPAVSLAFVVAASSAFPPILSPAKLLIDEATFTRDSNLELQKHPYTTNPTLADGGIYDNLGLETVWKRYKRVLVSDGGGRLSPQTHPITFWPLQTYRVLMIIDNQVRSLRKRQVIAGFKSPEDPHEGAYWGIGSHIEDFQVADCLDCPKSKTLELAEVPTRLGKLSDGTQERLINWGYAISDAAIRKHVDILIVPPKGFPFEKGLSA